MNENMKFNVGCSGCFFAGEMNDKTAKQCPDLDFPGLYRWYAKESDIRELMDSRYIWTAKGEFTSFYADIFDPYKDDKNLMLSKTVGGTRYYCIYIGIAKDRTLFNRIVVDHIKQEEATKNNAESLLKDDENISTLRWSISSLLAGDASEYTKTSMYINKFLVEYFADASDVEHISDREKKRIKAEEDYEIAEYITPLNIKGNEGDRLLGEFVNRLSQLRQETKNVALCKFDLEPDENDNDLEFPYLPIH